ncbi:ATP-grasp domain-containing protein [Alicyclobacillus fastidiosus]|uniref:ATP-grasp domain-containing protein n=1 Tax=Alicyclobacillus fastidiosus TaxID=392011 RepID=UPI0023E9CA53|nr:ATP-grasp domain-containing protein [Alicyclobacillus fastidiosus]GMA60061.1 hypothetical protein GCM10025859_05010 [Alicyclobacillus fastidiosus]
MRTIVFIGSQQSGSSRDAIVAAGDIGFYTVLLTNRENYIENRAEFPYVHEMIKTDIEDINEIKNKVDFLKKQGKQICAISSFVEPYVYTAAILGEEYRIPYQTPKAIATMLDKISMRELLRDTPYTPIFKTGHDCSVLNAEPRMHMPIVVKAPLSTGSKDVALARNRKEVEKQIFNLKKRYPEQKILLEEYLDGPQYLVEVLVHKGIPHIVAVVEQIVHGTRRFIIMGYRVPAKESDDLNKQIKDMVQVIVEKTGMKTGAFHIEFRVVNGQCNIIEVNPRISGSAMNRMINTAYGINLVQQTLKSQMGQEPDLVRKCERYVFTQYVTVSEGGFYRRSQVGKRPLLARV